MSDGTVTTYRDESLTVTEYPPSIPEDIHTITDEQLHALVRGVARASYQAARYRGQFNGDQLEPVQRRVVDRKAATWWEQNKGEYL